MTEVQLLHAEVAAAFVVFLAFCLVFALRPARGRPWWRDPYGRMVLFAHVATTLLLGDTLVGVVWPRFSGQLELAALLVGLLVVAGVWQLAALVRSLRGGGR